MLGSNIKFTQVFVNNELYKPCEKSTNSDFYLIYWDKKKISVFTDEHICSENLICEYMEKVWQWRACFAANNAILNRYPDHDKTAFLSFPLDDENFIAIHLTQGPRTELISN